MANTPEGKVKKTVKSVLATYDIVPAGSRRELQDEDSAANGWYYMPVKGTAMGVNGIHDFVLCVKGQFATIETKANGGTMTANQTIRARGVQRGGGKFFKIDEKSGMDLLETWLQEVCCG